MKQQRVDTGWAWAKKLNIPAGAKLGDTVYLSGICSLDEAGNVVAKGDVYGQSKRTFANIEEAWPAPERPWRMWSRLPPI